MTVGITTLAVLSACFEEDVMFILVRSVVPRIREVSSVVLTRACLRDRYWVPSPFQTFLSSRSLSSFLSCFVTRLLQVILADSHQATFEGYHILNPRGSIGGSLGFSM